MTAIEIGKWNPDLFAAFRKAKGARRRQLKGQLLIINAPLIKILVGQIAGIAEEKTVARRRNASRMRVVGADEAEWDDLMQMGLEGMSAALEKFDPEKGKIAGYARWWILTKIQRFVRKEHLVTAPEGKHAERPGVTLVDDEAELARMGGGAELDDEDLEAPEPTHTLEQLARFEKTGTWPEGMEAVRARFRAYSIPRPPFEVFVARLCTFRHAGRSPIWPLWNAWRVESALAGRDAGTRDRFLDGLKARGAREVVVRERDAWGKLASPVRGLAGVSSTPIMVENPGR